MHFWNTTAEPADVRNDILISFPLSQFSQSYSYPLHGGVGHCDKYRGTKAGATPRPTSGAHKLMRSDESRKAAFIIASKSETTREYLALSLALLSEAKTTDAKIPIMAITTSNSINVNPKEVTRADCVGGVLVLFIHHSISSGRLAYVLENHSVIKVYTNLKGVDSYLVKSS